MKWAIPAPEPAAHVGLVDGPGGGQRVLAVGQDRRDRRLVRDERPDVLRVLGHQRQRVHRAAAAGEQVDRSAAERLDDPMQVVRVLIGRRLGSSDRSFVLRSDPRGS